jgi:hypothetical protein
MGARIDKTESAVGVVRGSLNADISSGSWNKPLAVGINSSGKVVLGAGQTGIVGVAIFDKTNYRAGQVCDIFKLGDIILSGSDVLAAGTAYTANTTTGVITNAAVSGTQVAVGFTVEADRLVLKGLG